MDIEQTIRRTARCGMTDGTVMTVEFISGFELFDTRPYHNYETWAQGWRVSGLGVFVERESLAEAVTQWAALVTTKREGKDIPRSHQLSAHGRDGGTYRAGALLDDWIVGAKASQ